MTIDSVQYYDRKYSDNWGRAPEEVDPSLIERWKVIQDLICEGQITIRPDSQILDYGCGMGFMSSRLTGFGRVVGADLSMAALSYARRRYAEVRFTLCDGRNPAPFADGAFDVVLSSEVIEHLTDQSTYMLEIARLCKSNGTIILTTPNGRMRRYYFSSGRESWGQPIENWRTATELSSMLSSFFEMKYVSSFSSSWIWQLQHGGLPRILGNRGLIWLLAHVGALKRYSDLLEHRGWGLYLVLIGTRKPTL